MPRWNVIIVVKMTACCQLINIIRIIIQLLPILFSVLLDRFGEKTTALNTSEFFQQRAAQAYVSDTF